MPLYDYKCKCGNIQEVITLNVTDKSKPKCEKCGSKKMTRLMSRFGFKLVGEGWASDGYQKEFTTSICGEEKVKPCFSRKKRDEALQKVKNSMKGEDGQFKE